MDKTKYVKWYKIARDTINDESLTPFRADDEILDCVSEEDWLMFIPPDITRERAESLPEPNIYFYIRDDINRIGLTFNNVGSMDKIRNILLDYSSELKEILVEKLLKLDDRWKLSLNRKIKIKHFRNIPNFTRIFYINTNKIDNEKINKLFDLSTQIRKDGKIRREEERVKNDMWYSEVPSMDLMHIDIGLDEQEYKKRIIEAFDILKICLEVKSDTQIRKIQREEKKPVEVMKCPNCDNIFDYNTNRTVCGKIGCAGTELKKSKIPKVEYERLLKQDKIKS